MVHTERGNDSPLAGLSKPPAERGSNLAWLLLTSRKEGTRLPPAVVLRIGIDAAHRLEAARALALGRGTKGDGVHGALSPANVGVSRAGKVIVRREQFFQSRVYPRSPEQVAGLAPTARSDVFALGLVLYELLTGRVFYDLPDGPTPPRYRAREVTFPLERPSAVAALPPAVDAVLLRALEQAPEARFADAGEFGAALAALAAGTGLGATEAEVAAMLAGVMTPKREREREQELNAVLERLADTSGQLEALIAEKEKNPLQLVGPPPTDEELREFDDLGEPPPRLLDIQSAFDDQAPLPRELRSKDALTLFTRLVALGFERLGIKCETDLLSGQVTPAVVFSAEEEESFATVFGTLEGARALFFHTPFEAGQLVLTADYPRPPERSPRAVLTGHPGKSLAQLLALHRREVEVMKAAGARPCGTWDRQAQLAATDAWYAHPDYFDV